MAVVLVEEMASALPQQYDPPAAGDVIASGAVVDHMGHLRFNCS